MHLYDISIFPQEEDKEYNPKALEYANTTVGTAIKGLSIQSLAKITQSIPWTSSIFSFNLPNYSENEEKKRFALEKRIEMTNNVLKRKKLQANQYKNTENFLYKQLIELDYDDGLKLSDAFTVFSKFKHIIGTTNSHRKDKGGVIADRFRVILFLDEAITTKEELQTIGQNLFDKSFLGWNIVMPDPNSFLPTTLWQAFKTIVSINEEGELLPKKDLLNFKPLAVKPKELLKELTDEEILKYNVGKIRPLQKTTQTFLEFGVKGMESNSKLVKRSGQTLQANETFRNYFYKASLDLRASGYTFQQALDLLREVPHTEEYKRTTFRTTYTGYLESIYNTPLSNNVYVKIKSENEKKASEKKNYYKNKKNESIQKFLDKQKKEEEITPPLQNPLAIE